MVKDRTMVKDRVTVVKDRVTVVKDRTMIKDLPAVPVTIWTFGAIN